jgi:hypothetical protein
MDLGHQRVDPFLGSDQGLHGLLRKIYNVSGIVNDTSDRSPTSHLKFLYM